MTRTTTCTHCCQPVTVALHDVTEDEAAGIAQRLVCPSCARGVCRQPGPHHCAPDASVTLWRPGGAGVAKMGRENFKESLPEVTLSTVVRPSIQIL